VIEAPSYAIRAVATEIGERALSAAEIASQHGLSETVVRTSLGDKQVYATSRPRHELSRAAAQKCLDRAGVSLGDVDFLVWSVTRGDVPVGPPLGVLLGRPDVPAVHFTGTCTVLFRAIWMARAWLRSEGRHRALVVYSETCEDTPRILKPLGEGPRDVLSDGAAAVLIEDGPGLALRGLSLIDNGARWDYFLRNVPGAGAETEDLQVLHESMTGARRTLKSALDAAGFTQESLDLVVMPNEANPLMDFLARQMRLPASRVACVPNAPSHVWAVDQFYNLEQLATTRGFQEGERIACVARGVGMSGALVLEVAGGGLAR
jgi:3-oxoacyl-[acyl-carrier-protein] synthase III